MGLCKITVDEILKHLPAKILSLGFPDHLDGHVNLDGSTLTCIDLFKHKGSEIVVDLSEYGSLAFLGKFDVVLDCGTIEHCANIANGFINAASAVAFGGHIIHHLGINQINHGYWSVCPTFLTDFYTANNFQIERMDMTTDATFFEGKIEPWPSNDPNLNRHIIPYPALVLCVAKRNSLNPITLPLCQRQWLTK